MIKKTGMLFLILLTCVSMAIPVYSESEQVEEVYGTIMELNDTSITLEVWDYDLEQEKEVAETISYEILPETEIDKEESLTESIEGQDAEILYMEENGRKIAKNIYVYSEYEEE